jgi:hypothetical protein
MYIIVFSCHYDWLITSLIFFNVHYCFQLPLRLANHFSAGAHTTFNTQLTQVGALQGDGPVAFSAKEGGGEVITHSIVCTVDSAETCRVLPL